MTLIVLPTWETPQGETTSAWGYPAVKTEADAWRLIQRAIDECRRAKGINLRVAVIDDIAWRILFRVKPRVSPFNVGGEDKP